MIGTTVIDLEERWTSAGWHQFARKPLELRTLRAPNSELSQGQLELWVDIIPKSTIHSFPLVLTRPPISTEFELRVAVWETKYAPLLLRGKSDLFVKGTFVGHGGPAQVQETDVHFAVKDGKGLFNWRLVFRMTLPAAKDAQLILEVSVLRCSCMPHRRRHQKKRSFLTKLAVAI